MKDQTQRARILALMLASTVALMAAPSLADEVRNLCKQDAKEEKLMCKLECAETYQVARDECRNVDHACADACRAARAVCLDLPLAGLEVCKEDCATTKDAAIQACRDTYDPVTQAAELDQCIDDAQVAAFICRDTCREAVDRDEIRTCRKAFRACIRVCPRADDGGGN